MKTAWVRAKVLEASDRVYPEAVLPLFDRARKEIAISLYLMMPNDSAGPDHPVNRLLEALLRACERGVRVRIFLNTRFRVREKTEVGQGVYFERLLEAGAEVTTLLPVRRLHDKLIVIDSRYVIEGSMNWSISAMKENYESVSIIDSPAHAGKKLERIATLTLPPPTVRARAIDRPLLPLPATVEIPRSLFSATPHGARLPAVGQGSANFTQMVRSSDIRTFNLYLILLGQAEAEGKKERDMDLETLAQALHLPPDWDRSRSRRQVIKTLRKLALRYKLIEVEFPFARDARVRLKELAGEKVVLPGRLFEPNSFSQESSGITFLGLAREVLRKEGIEIDSLSAPELEKRFGIDASTFIHARAQATKDLR